MAVAKEGDSVDSKEVRLLEMGCHITVLPGNPTKAFLEGDDWDVVSLLAVVVVMMCGDDVWCEM